MKKRYLSIVAATLLAVSPVATGVVGLTNQPTEVKAATSLTSDQLMEPYYRSEASIPDAFRTDDEYVILKLSKKNPYLYAQNGETVSQLTKKRITDITANYGHVDKCLSVRIYKTMDDGRPDFGHAVRGDESLKSGQNYVAAITCEIASLPEGRYYYVISADDDEMNAGETTDGGDTTSVLLVPVKVSATNYKNTAISRKAYITVARNHKVRTYTSTGKFSGSYVYGHHTYKVTSKRYISRRGTCYKISGKNQWIQSKYILFR